MAPSPPEAEDMLAGVKKMSMKTTNSSARISDTGEEGEGLVKREAAVYLDAKTYVYLEIELHNPLIWKRPLSALAEK